MALLSTHAAAQVSYLDSHAFTVQFGQGVPATARWQHFEHTWMYWEGSGDDVQTNPSAQPPGWFPRAPTGFDAAAMRATGMNHQRQQMTLNMVEEEYDPRTPFDQRRSIEAHANIGVSRAQASLITAPATSNANILTGTISVDGSISTNDRHKGGLASSISVLRFDVTNQNQWPRVIAWTPHVEITSNGMGTVESNSVMLMPRDPIYFEIIGPDGEVVRIPAVDIWLEEAKAAEPTQPMDFQWTNGRLTGTNVGELWLRALVGGQNMLPGSRGSAAMHFANGQLVESIGTGIFEHAMPPVGMSGTFDFEFINTLNLDFTPLELPPGYTGAFELSSGLNIPSPGSTVMLLSICLATRRRRG
jgi:hypothetical protein